MSYLMRILPIPAALLLAACGLFEPAAVSEAPARSASTEETGSVDMTIELEKTMSLAKRSEIALARLCITLSAAGVDSIFDTLKVSGNVQQVASKTYNKLAAGKHWRLRVKSLDKMDSVVHTGTAVFEVQPRQTAHDFLRASSRFAMLRAAFFPIKDSVNRCAIYLDDKLVADSVFNRKELSGDTLFLPFDYVSVDLVHKIRLAAYGRVWGVDTVLYQGDTTFKAVSGADGGFRIALNGTGFSSHASGSAAMEVTLGRVGRVSVRGELLDATAHNGLVLHLPMNGNAKDLSDFANHGFVNGAAAAEDRFGRKNGALAFDGKDDHVVIPTSPSLKLKKAVTISMWIKPSENRYQYLLDKQDYKITWGYNRVSGYVAAGNYSTLDMAVEMNKGWSHVVFTWDGINTAFYLDGTLIKEENQRGELWGSNYDMVLGGTCIRDHKDYPYAGAMDDLQVYNRALSKEDVAALHKAESIKP